MKPIFVSNFRALPILHLLGHKGRGLCIIFQDESPRHYLLSSGDIVERTKFAPLILPTGQNVGFYIENRMKGFNCRNSQNRLAKRFQSQL